ncbi:MAG TPA: hypothetical protein VL128_03805 [Candidatus Eisenbacteria bacterium]|nr:hypothetical protein [Candidatus Eisenbacteria bacterium]
MSTQNLRPNAHGQQRRSQRILLAVPLRVSGKRPNGTAFVEHTNTLIVNAHGGLITLRETVQRGQEVALWNAKTGEEVRCLVVDVNEGPSGTPEVGVEFTEANPRFWRVSFPPSDWSARSPEAKRYASRTNPLSVPVNLPATKK